MNDYLGTSIQFSEQQLLRLEQEYDFQMEQTAQRLIESGFLDSDYDGSSGEFTDFDDDDSEVDPSDISDDTSSDHDIVDNIERNDNENFESTPKYNLHQNQNENNLSLNEIISDVSVGSTDHIMESINDKENELSTKIKKVQEEDTEDEKDENKEVEEEMKSYSSSDYEELLENEELDEMIENESQILYAIISAYDEDEDEDKEQTEKEHGNDDNHNHTKIHSFDGYIAINDKYEMFAEPLFHFLNNQCSQMIIIDIEDVIYEIINQYFSCFISTV